VRRFLKEITGHAQTKNAKRKVENFMQTTSKDFQIIPS
jgi:hypothetical protein